MVFGYRDADDYWMLVAEAVSTTQYRVRLHHVVNGSKGAALGESALNAVTVGSSVDLAIRGKRNSLHGWVNHNFPDGFPSGKYGLISNVAGGQFEFSQVPWGQISGNPNGRWLDQSTYLAAAGGTLYLGGDYKKQFTPTLAGNVSARKVKAWFKVTRNPAYDPSYAKFVFDARDTEDFKQVNFYHGSASYGAKVIQGVTDGHVPVSYGYTTNGSNAVARAAATDPLWVCVLLDPAEPNGRSVRMFEATSESGLDGKVSGDQWSMANSGMLTLGGGRVGFSSGSGGIHVDDLTVQAWDAASSSWKTQFVESFDSDVGNYVTHQVEHDAAGNLAYDGVQHYTYDAWNRMVAVAHAYRDANNDLQSGTKFTTMSYDGRGRRITKSVTNTGYLDATYHYYHDGDSLIETRNGSDIPIKHHVWGITYIDELVQTSVNTNPHQDSTLDAEYWAACDANYNVLGIIDSSGVLVERYEYTPYGQRTVYFSPGVNDPALSASTNSSRRVTSGGVSQPYGLNEISHQGLHHDEEVLLVYNRARMLHPGLGRFMQRDPMEYFNGTSVYEYVGSMPLYWLDPSGLLWYHGYSDAFKSVFGFADPETQAAFDQSNWDRTNGTLDGMTRNNVDLDGYHGGDYQRKAHTFDEETRKKAECFEQCWESKMASAVTQGLLGRLPGNAGYLGAIPHDFDPEDVIGGLVSSAGVATDKYGRDIAKDRANRGPSARQKWHDRGKPSYRSGVSFKDWAKDERAKTASRSKAAKFGGGALAAGALFHELWRCYDECEECLD